MTEIIFTYRPRKTGKPISIINRITRRISQSPHDHVAMSCHYDYINGKIVRCNELKVWESTAGKGVQIIPYTEWVKGREGTWLDCYSVPDNDINFDMYVLAHEKPYDTGDAVAHFLAQFRLTQRMADRIFKTKLVDKFTCSKFIGMLLDYVGWPSALPVNIVRLCEMRNYPLDKREL